MQVLNCLRFCGRSVRPSALAASPVPLEAASPISICRLRSQVGRIQWAEIPRADSRSDPPGPIASPAALIRASGSARPVVVTREGVESRADVIVHLQSLMDDDDGRPNADKGDEDALWEPAGSESVRAPRSILRSPLGAREAGNGTVWVADGGAGQLVHFDRRTRELLAVLPMMDGSGGSFVTDVSVMADGRLVVVDGGRFTVSVVSGLGGGVSAVSFGVPVHFVVRNRWVVSADGERVFRLSVDAHESSAISAECVVDDGELEAARQALHERFNGIGGSDGSVSTVPEKGWVDGSGVLLGDYSGMLGVPAVRQVQRRVFWSLLDGRGESGVEMFAVRRRTGPTDEVDIDSTLIHNSGAGGDRDEVDGSAGALMAGADSHLTNAHNALVAEVGSSSKKKSKNCENDDVSSVPAHRAFKYRHNYHGRVVTSPQIMAHADHELRVSIRLQAPAASEMELLHAELIDREVCGSAVDVHLFPELIAADEAKNKRYDYMMSLATLGGLEDDDEDDNDVEAVADPDEDEDGDGDGDDSRRRSGGPGDDSDVVFYTDVHTARGTADITFDVVAYLRDGRTDTVVRDCIHVRIPLRLYKGASRKPIEFAVATSVDADERVLY